MSQAITVRHNFEMAHRLFGQGPGTKCWNLHGHSWWATVTVEAPATDEQGMVVEFGAFKKALRGYIDAELDHATLLNEHDPLVAALVAQDSQVGLFHHDPTVEAVAAHLARVAGDLLADLPHALGAYVARVDVSETHVNGASWLSA